MEQTLSRLFRYGTTAASIVVAIGLALSELDTTRTPSGTTVMTAGIAIFALLPVAGLSLMSRQFARTRDWKLSAISISVLVIIAIGICVGVILGKTSH
jgi:uncharacterized membrane protein